MTIRTLSVDYDNPSDLKKLIQKLSSRRKKLLEDLGYKQIGFNGSKFNMDNVMPIIQNMLDADLTNIYKECDVAERYHVYVHCNPFEPLQVTADLKHLVMAQRYGLTHVPFYVGKGTGDRYCQLDRNDSHRKVRSKILKKGKEVIAVKIVDNVCESEAFALESKIIDILGIRSYSENGLLVNLDEGYRPSERRACYGENASKVLKQNGFVI